MPHPTPPRRRGGPKVNVSSARRRIRTQDTLTPGKDKPVYSPPPPPAVQPGPVISQHQQPTTSPPRVLGSEPQPTDNGERLTPRGAPTGDSLIPGSTQVNRTTPTAQASDAARERVGHRFTVGFTSDGRIVHLYGSGVDPSQRRVVLSKSKTAAAKRRMGYAE